MHPFFQSLIQRFHDAPKRTRLIIWGVLALILISTVLISSLSLSEMADWERAYRPAALLMAHGHSPYENLNFLNPPWVLIPLIPIALLPLQIGKGVLLVVSLLAVIYTAIRMGATPISFLAFVLSFPVLFMLSFGQIDWMVMLGFLMPPQIGLFFILAKPQSGLALALFYLIEALRTGGIRKALITFIPVVLGYGLSFLIYGLWFMDIPDYGLIQAKYNFSFWPLGIPIGAIILFMAIRQRNKHMSILAGPFFSPYVAPQSWTTALIGLLPMQWECVIASLGTWIMLYMGIMR